MDEILHHLKKLGNHDSPVNTNKQWFPIASWVVRNGFRPSTVGLLKAPPRAVYTIKIVRKGEKDTDMSKT